ncbi:regulatory protein RecX [Sandaracinobacter neustonicus]|uniref:Regulatory protein RecX n=1 Tax=Sandaracinobacter neustonicus TaxID=1715348 RepID=A0A501XF04_9SPHN|nr:regulatory protein RecX [Sandaracinobacter neustonicus]TPE59096.1 regulatory protein RecX [Sandaracinobacter neustonicus]
MGRDTRSKGPKKPPPPLDQAALEAIALRYLERFQTSRARLLRLLQQKIRARGWKEDAPPPDPEAIAERMVTLGYVNDAAFAEARTRGLARRGMGAGRVQAALSAYGIDADTRSTALEGHDPWAAALDFARRKRLGPFGPPINDPKLRNRQMGAFARAGHPHGLANRIVAAQSEEDLESE